LAAPAEVGAGSSLRTLRAKSVIGMAVPAGYVTPVNGLRTSTARMPCRCVALGIVVNETFWRFCLNPS
jgi:hypothetical protein